MDDAISKALADAGRRRLLDSLNARGGQTLRKLCAGLEWPGSRSAITSPSWRRRTW